MTPPDKTPGAKQRSTAGVILEWVGLLVAAFVIAWLIVTFVVQVFVVPSGSMIPTIQPGDRLLVAKFAYAIGEPQRGDVVVFKNWTPGDPDLIKRLIAVPGDTIGMTQDAGFTLNGKRLSEPYLAADARHTGPGETAFPVKLGAGEYWMMGDNRNNSGDSRYNGPITRAAMVGKALFVFWPFSDARLF